MVKKVYCDRKARVFHVICAFFTYFDYFEPYFYPLHFLQGDVQVINENILVGPYPHYDEIERLKKKFGVTVIISLLNADLPQEKALLKREEKMAQKIGITVYNYPLEYFHVNSEHNQKTIDQLTVFIKNLRNDKVYIHCYLGKNRVEKVKSKLKFPCFTGTYIFGASVRFGLIALRR